MTPDTFFRFFADTFHIIGGIFTGRVFSGGTVCGRLSAFTGGLSFHTRNPDTVFQFFGEVGVEKKSQSAVIENTLQGVFQKVKQFTGGFGGTERRNQIFPAGVKISLKNTFISACHGFITDGTQCGGFA